MRQVAAGKAKALVFDREHLCRYTMDSEALEREIVGLFLLQLPLMIDLLKTAADQTQWRFATHTLKGSALAIGAARLAQAVRRLEAVPRPVNGTNLRLMAVLDREIASFRRAAARIYR